MVQTLACPSQHLELHMFLRYEQVGAVTSTGKEIRDVLVGHWPTQLGCLLNPGYSTVFLIQNMLNGQLMHFVLMDLRLRRKRATI